MLDNIFQKNDYIIINEIDSFKNYTQISIKMTDYGCKALLVAMKKPELDKLQELFNQEEKAQEVTNLTK